MMGTDDMNLVPPQRVGDGMSSRLVFEGAGGDPSGSSVRRPTAAAAGFAVNCDKIFSNADSRFFLHQRGDLPRSGFFGSAGGMGQEHDLGHSQWNAEESNRGVRSGDESASDEDEDDDDEEDDVDNGDGEIDGLVSTDNGGLKGRHNSSGSAQSTSEKLCCDKMNSLEDQSSFGSSRGGMEKDGNDTSRGSMNGRQLHQGRMGQYENTMTIADPELYYAQILQGGDVLPSTQKETTREDERGFRGRKDISPSMDFGDSLRMHLSDPITGALMDDAMILICGHSFGSVGIQHVNKTRACCKCGQPISEELIRPNFALRSAVQAFRREEELHSSRATKRRRDRFEQDKCDYDYFFPADGSRGKGVQFPFAVSDRVIIKGNKRTPPRFVGRVAVVTAQCLNGWYVVKTLDNAESVKLQYRSLAKAGDDTSTITVPSKTAAQNWL